MERIRPIFTPVPEPWRAARSELTDWAHTHLINRLDARGGYYLKHGVVRRTTRKTTDRHWQPHEVALRNHVAATHAQHIVGLHSTSPENTSKWLGIDIDAHRGEDPTDNLKIAIELCDRLEGYGVTGHIFDSDGRGGIHLLAFFGSPISTSHVYRLAQRVVNGFTAETYPKQPKIPVGGFGNWLRLPGRHHTRNHWTRYWGGEGWLDATGTVNAILAIEPCAFPDLPALIRVKPICRRMRRRRQSGSTSFTDSSASLQTWLEDHGICVKETRSTGNETTVLVLGRCPFFGDHGDADGDTSVAVTWRPTGVGFRCFHNRCAHFRWRDLRAKLDPGRQAHRHGLQRVQETQAHAEPGPNATHATCRIRTIRIRFDTKIRSQV